MFSRLRRISWDPDRGRQAIFLILSAVTVIAAPDAAKRWICAGVLLVAFVAYVVLLRGPERLRPAALLICAAGGVTSILLAHNGVGEWPVLMCAVYARTVFRGWAGILVTTVLALAFGFCISWITRSPVGLLAGIGVPILAQRRLQQEALQAERDRALALLAELEAARDAQAQAAALEERGRIAREMHDVLAHSLAGLSLQLQAVRAVAGRSGVGPEVIEPLDRAAQLARTGVEEAKAAVGALRETAPLGIADVPHLVERFPGQARLTESGMAQPVDPALGHAVYRAVQESLTNAARYAPGSAVAVALQWGDGALQVSVSDDGAAPGHVPETSGSGYGLKGMGERLAAVGATFSAAPSGSGWRVLIAAPLTEPVGQGRVSEA